MGVFAASQSSSFAKNPWQILPEVTGKLCQDFLAGIARTPVKEDDPMPLLKPPAPDVTKRKYYVRIDEPLALKMEKYAEFLGARTVDHVISQALEFVFRKDSEFNAWIAEHPEIPHPRATKSNGSKPNGTMAEKKSPEMAATARSTI